MRGKSFNSKGDFIDKGPKTSPSSSSTLPFFRKRRHSIEMNKNAEDGDDLFFTTKSAGKDNFQILFIDSTSAKCACLSDTIYLYWKI